MENVIYSVNDEKFIQNMGSYYLRIVRIFFFSNFGGFVITNILIYYDEFNML